jgi:hypothetical protein
LDQANYPVAILVNGADLYSVADNQTGMELALQGTYQINVIDSIGASTSVSFVLR